MSEYKRFSIDIRRKRRPPPLLEIGGVAYHATGRVGDKWDTWHRGYGDDPPQRVHEYRTAVAGVEPVRWVHDDGTPVDERDCLIDGDDA